MFAIVNIKGKQYKISENQKLFIPKLSDEVGKKVTFSDVLAYSSDDKSLQMGSPNLTMKVQATVLNHVKDEKVMVFKKKRRKNYRRTRGHRQQYTEVEVTSLK